MRFEKLKNDILGKEYSFSLAFVSENKSRKINKKYRQQDKPTNILSFALHKNSGELVLCKAVIKREVKNSPKTFDQYLIFLVIHGMLHLKGMQHGSIMSKREKFFYGKYAKKHFDRNRRRIGNNPSRHGRVFKRRKKS